MAQAAGAAERSTRRTPERAADSRVSATNPCCLGLRTPRTGPAGARPSPGLHVVISDPLAPADKIYSVSSAPELTRVRRGRRRRRRGKRILLAALLHLHLVDELAQELAAQRGHALAPLELVGGVDVLLRLLLARERAHARDAAGVRARVLVVEGVQAIGAGEVVVHDPQEHARARLG